MVYEYYLSTTNNWLPKLHCGFRVLCNWLVIKLKCLENGRLLFLILLPRPLPTLFPRPLHTPLPQVTSHPLPQNTSHPLPRSLPTLFPGHFPHSSPNHFTTLFHRPLHTLFPRPLHTLFPRPLTPPPSLLPRLPYTWADEQFHGLRWTTAAWRGEDGCMEWSPRLLQSRSWQQGLSLR